VLVNLSSRVNRLADWVVRQSSTTR
jgi:hypothetical protein